MSSLLFGLTTLTRNRLLVAIFNRELAIRLGSSDKYRHIITQTVHPGVIATRLFTDLYSWSHPFRTISAFSFGSAGISTVNGANALLKAVVSDDHERAVKGGQYFNRVRSCSCGQEAKLRSCRHGLDSQDPRLTTQRRGGKCGRWSWSKRD